MKKAGRNDPCPCGSGKKFKKCCEANAVRGRFSAARIDAASAPQIQKAGGLTSLFQASTFAIPRKTAPPVDFPAEAPLKAPEMPQTTRAAAAPVENPEA